MASINMQDTTRYFIAKCFNIQGLKKCWTSSQWACNQRKYGTQTWEILHEAYSQGKVVLIFSVNNCHGYHGYTVLTSPPSSTAEKLEKPDDESDMTASEKELQEGLWHKFTVEWIKIFVDKHGEKCLPFNQTKHLMCSDDKTPINKARNFQEVDCNTGEELCRLIQEEYSKLDQIVARNLEIKEAKKPDPFLKISSENEMESDNIWDTVLKAILEKVGSMGKIILACPFGSQRYNCHTINSDVDMFIVYQAPTEALLSFSPPQNTIKNREGEKYDYTILELHRYLELLITGDPRCVETLFLNEVGVYKDSPEYRHLCHWKYRFLTKQCVEKYLNDACGAKGFRLLEKWTKSGEALQTPMPSKVGKLFYIIIRLLQNACDIVKSHSINVFRTDGSEEKTLLMQARACQLTYEECKCKVDYMEKQARELKETDDGKFPNDAVSLKTDVENWMIGLRYSNMKDCFDNST